MNTMDVVVIAEVSQLPREIDSVPEEHAVEILTPNRPNQSFYEWMRNRRVRNRLDLLDLEYSQIGEPTVESEQRIMIGTESLRFGLTDRGATEHSANRNAVDGGALDAEADDATGKYVHDQHDPMAAHQDRFNTKQISTPEAVLGLREEGQPGGAIRPRMAGTIMDREHTAHRILVDLDAEGMRNLLGDAQIAEVRIARFHLDDRRDEFCGRTFGPGRRRCGDEEKSRRYFRSTNALWNFSSVTGLISAPSFTSRRGVTNSVVNPSRKRSIDVRFGARCRERLLISS